MLRPLVLGPDSLPVTTDPARIAAEPELGVLSVMAGTGKQAVQAALVTLGVVRGLEAARARLYADLVMMHVPRAMRSALEKLMDLGTYKFQSPYARKYIAQGEAQAGVRAVLRVLKARRLSPSERERKRILACKDPRKLEWWLGRAATAERVSDIFIPLKARKARARVRKSAK